MDEQRQLDPFDWDVQQVVAALCRPDSLIAADTTTLESKIRENEFDGKTLLTLGHVCPNIDIFQCLGIVPVRRKVALGELIHELRSKSPGFRSWLKNFHKAKVNPETDSQPNGSARSESPHDPAANGTGNKLDLLSNGAGSRQDPAPLGLKTPVSAPKDGEPGHSSETFRAERQKSQPVPESESRKRKRIEPVNVSSQPRGKRNDFFNDIASPWESGELGQYLGPARIEISSIKLSEGRMGPGVVDFDDGGFVAKGASNIPIGRQQFIAQTMRRLLLRNSRREALFGSGAQPLSHVTPSEEDDPILDWSDLPDEVDELTRAEMEQERLELQAHKVSEELTRDAAEAFLDSFIQEFTQNWKVTKLLRIEKKAHKIWTDALKSGERKYRIEKARRTLQGLDGRIRKLYNGILDEKWRKEDEIRTVTRTLEPTLQDRLYYRWLIGILQSNAAPPKPDLVLRPMPKKVTRVDDYCSDGELLMSSDDDDFIVPDGEEEEHGLVVREKTPTSGHRGYDIQISPVTAESPIYVDLTQMSQTTPNGQQEKTIVDLTTPIKLKFSDDEAPPPMASLQNIEEIVQNDPKHWARQNDRWRLIMTILWRLPHLRRQLILSLVAKNEAHEVWQAAVDPQLSNPLEDLDQDAIPAEQYRAFDTTRVLFCFTRCKFFTEQRCLKLSPNDRRRIEKSEGKCFDSLCSFVRSVASLFPEDSQVFRAETFEEDPLDENDGDGSAEMVGPPTKLRRPAIKEIIQDKDAISIRERVDQRHAEQQARRERLRADLAAASHMPQDKMDHIINLSKQDDQHFIYINEQIGERIKAHQIDGVRFLWDQIILNADVNQGCLLAHTMGLGKTMQVITLLVAIAEASASPDESISKQVPATLQASQTLILCPAGLVDNWMDELLIWAPDGKLGNLSKIESSLSEADRVSTVADWSERGGILICGYGMFKRMSYRNDDTQRALFQKPNLVVADEAHVFKNRDTLVHAACRRFRTNSRIALTGSPLANNVEEYYAMIDWVAPNFLGPLSEFRQIYANPIQHGLWNDSSGPQKRRALTCLTALKRTVASKVNRATIQCLKDDLPQKHEFVISVSPTTMQHELYDLYVKGTQTDEHVSILAAIEALALICNHPKCFREKVREIHGEMQGGDSTRQFPKGVIELALQKTNNPDLDNPELSHKARLLTIILDEAQRVGDKVLVFSHSMQTLDYLEFMFKLGKRRVSRLDGNTQIRVRQEMIKDFNAGDKEVYLISTNAGGVGLNIHGANRIVIFDSRWNPQQEQQAIGRAYRIGQKKTVYVYQLVMAGSFEEDLHNKAVFKMQLASRVVDKKNPVSWSKRKGQILHDIHKAPKTDITSFVGKDHILDKLIAQEEGGHTIRSIISTDTFDEEDPTAKLTIEEQADAEKITNLQLIRDQLGSAEFQRRMMEIERPSEHNSRQQVYASASSVGPTRAPEAPVTMTPTPMNGAPMTTAGPAAPAHPSGLQSQAAEGPQQTDETHNSPPSVSQSMDGSSDAPFTVAQHHTTAAPQQQPGGSDVSWMAPQPIPGANTYFRREETSNISTKPSPGSHSSWLLAQTAESRRNPVTPLFSTPQDTGKADFQEGLMRGIRNLQNEGRLGKVDSAEKVAKSMVVAIETCRREQDLGTLPNMEQWIHLQGMLRHDRFLMAVSLGHLSAGFLAFASNDELERRMRTLNGVTEEELRTKLTNSPRWQDPENLRNIGRANSHEDATPRTSQGRQDLNVMRETADNRRRHGSRLPSWARRSLAEGRKDPSH